MPRKKWLAGALRPQLRSRSPVKTRSRTVAGRIPATRQSPRLGTSSESDTFTCWAIVPRIEWVIDLKDYATPQPVVGHPLPLVSRVFKHQLMPIWQRVARRWYAANWWRFFYFQIVFNQAGRASLQQRLVANAVHLGEKGSVDYTHPPGAVTTTSEARARRLVAARKKRPEMH